MGSSIIGCMGEYEGTAGTFQLFLVEPTGVVSKCKAMAIGKGRQSVKSDLERLDRQNLGWEEALFKAAKIVRKAHDEKDRDYELELAVISPATGYQLRIVEPAKCKELDARAKAEVEAEADEDD